jgi:hypothetical protein
MGAEARRIIPRLDNSLDPHFVDNLEVLGVLRKPKKSQNAYQSTSMSFFRFLKQCNLLTMFGLDEAVERGLIKEAVGQHSKHRLRFAPAKLDHSLVWPKFVKYQERDRDINRSAWSKALEFLYRHYLSNLSGVNYIRTSKLKDHVLRNAEDLSGSVGAAFGMMAKDKKEFIENFFQHYENFLENIRSCPVTIWKIFVKEELRDSEKVFDSPSSRIIFGSSAIQFLMGYQLFFELQERFINNRDLFWSSAGMDFSGAEYGQKIGKFARSKVCSVDGSAFDAQMQQQDIVDIYQLFYMCFKESEKDEFFCDLLACHMANSIFSVCLLPDGRLVQKTCGNPTGDYLTLMRNTMHNYRLYAYVWICDRMSKGLSCEYEDYHKNHFALMNGDDCIITASDSMNWGTISKYMSKFLELTSVQVNGKNEISIFEATYCGRVPTLVNGHYVPVMDSYKLVLSVLFKNLKGHLKERVNGAIVANPFDDWFVSLLTEFCKIKGYPVVPVNAIRSNYFYKESFVKQSNQEVRPMKNSPPKKLIKLVIMQNAKKRIRNRTTGKRNNKKKPATRGEIQNVEQQLSGLRRRIGENPKRGRYWNSGVSTRGSTGSSDNQYDVLSTLNAKRGKSYDVLRDTYFGALLNPMTVNNARIPDNSMFPCSLMQSRTVGEVTIGDVVDGAGTFCLYASPFQFESNSFFQGGPTPTTEAEASFITIDGVKYGPAGDWDPTRQSTFSTHIYESVEGMIPLFRIVSMCVRVKYTGSPLNASGRIACGLFPPYSHLLNIDEYNEVAEYNYAYSGAAKDGCMQLWFPLGAQSFQFYPFAWNGDVTTDTDVYDEMPFIIVSGDGIPAGKQLTIEIVSNLEVYATNQVFTANKYAGKPNPAVMSHTLATASAVLTGGKSNGTYGSGNSIWNTALDIGKGLLKEYGPQMAESLVGLFL